ncbi:hypothetical protein ACLOJK_015477 [Asimina triloba]
MIYSAAAGVSLPLAESLFLFLAWPCFLQFLKKFRAPKQGFRSSWLSLLLKPLPIPRFQQSKISIQTPHFSLSFALDYADSSPFPSEMSRRILKKIVGIRVSCYGVSANPRIKFVTLPLHSLGPSRSSRAPHRLPLEFEEERDYVGIEQYWGPKSETMLVLNSVGAEKFIFVEVSNTSVFVLLDVICKGRKEFFPLSISLTTKKSQDSADAINPGNNLYVTGLSTRVTDSELEKYFSSEGKVTECHLVMDPRTRESRGFGFVTMETVEEAERCIKYLNRSVLEGRLITVEKHCSSAEMLPAQAGLNWRGLWSIWVTFSWESERIIFLALAAAMVVVVLMMVLLLWDAAKVVHCKTEAWEDAYSWKISGSERQERSGVGIAGFYKFLQDAIET